MTAVIAQAPGRVNLIGDHTDYSGGLVLPMAIDRWTTVRGQPAGGWVDLRSEAEPEPAVVALGERNPSSVSPAWARYVAGVVAQIRPLNGFTGTVRSTIPVGAGLSSSAALEVAVALALGFDQDPLALAMACQAAEQRASGVPCGIMDQLASAAGVEGHALLIDCSTLSVKPVAVPEDVDVVVVDSGERRALAESAYAERAAQCRYAADLVGPLNVARLADVEAIKDELIRARARHVVTENARVALFAELLTTGDLHAAGSLMAASHASLRHDFGVSTPTLDALVDELSSRPGVYGARLTGAGFGGCVVALCQPGALEGVGWLVRPVGGATVTTSS